MNNRWVRAAAIWMLAGTAGCGGGWDRESMMPLGPTLEIFNESSLVYRVTVSAGTVLHLYPGQNKCVYVGRTNKQRRIEFLPMAGSRRYYTPPENLMSESGWVVEIGEFPFYDVLSLRPADPCKA